MLADELYFALLEVGYCARRQRIPDPLASTLINIAQCSLELWRRDEQAVMRFARRVLSGPTNLRETTGRLPKPVASACLRLLKLLEALSDSRSPPFSVALQAAATIKVVRFSLFRLLFSNG